MLGNDLQAVFPDATLLDFAYKSDGFQRRRHCDIADRQSVVDGLSDIKAGDIVINAAAFTNVDGAEAERDKAFAVNAIGPQNLVEVVRGTDAHLVQVSTDYVFPGKGDDDHTPYTEQDAVGNVGNLCVYGASKLQGEQAVLEGGGTVMRTANLYGSGGKNVVAAMVDHANRTGQLTGTMDDFGSPTYTRDLARMIRGVVNMGVELRSGKVFHAVNMGTCSMMDLATHVGAFVRRTHTRTVEVTGTTLEAFGRDRAARRPGFTPLDNTQLSDLLESQGHAPIRSYTKALGDYLGHHH